MIKEILLFLWQLPQNLFGLVILLINCKSVKKIEENGIKYFKVKHLADCGISLANLIILDSDMHHSENTIKHEYGHQLQSRKLGLSYLIFIGLPSLIGNLMNRYCHKKWTSEQRSQWYYNLPWEYWADKLGNVVRES